ncbi:MAG: methyltransferase domain-containing protein [Anaerolineales bacterium]|jgi:ubiquinone/menaquinone biosynthesis C-methylase UbiE|nr:methyltransferase domain-containing protein [Anaerolineales bacterium]
MTSPLSFPASDFDSWAATYDESVQAESSFPFDGYTQVLQHILSLSTVSSGQAVLDLGTGTANLALQFAERGCRLTCTDFSQAMLAVARQKLPQADFILHAKKIHTYLENVDLNKCSIHLVLSGGPHDSAGRSRRTFSWK